jgi:hypothetical protein
MTCRGYDSKAVKIGKLVKIAAAGIQDKHQRGAFIQSFVRVEQEATRQRSSRKEREQK